MLGDDNPIPPLEQPWFSALRGAADGRAALRAFVEGNGAIVRRAGVLDDVIRSATHEPDAVAVHERSERLRRDGYNKVAEHLGATFGLRDGVSVREATDLLLTLAGPGVYRALVVDYGWSDDAYLDWLTQTLSEALLRPPRSRGQRR